jgi:hypothetical protein
VQLLPCSIFNDPHLPKQELDRAQLLSCSIFNDPHLPKQKLDQVQLLRYSIFEDAHPVIFLAHSIREVVHSALDLRNKNRQRDQSSLTVYQLPIYQLTNYRNLFVYVHNPSPS